MELVHDMAVTTMEKNTMTGDDMAERLDNARQVLAAYRTMKHRRHQAWLYANDNEVAQRYAELRQAELQTDAAQATVQQLTARMDCAK